MEEANKQKVRIMALTAKDLKPGKEQITVADLSVRQVAYAIAWCQPWIVPSDMLEMGGEMDGHGFGFLILPYSCL